MQNCAWATAVQRHMATPHSPNLTAPMHNAGRTAASQKVKRISTHATQAFPTEERSAVGMRCDALRAARVTSVEVGDPCSLLQHLPVVTLHLAAVTKHLAAATIHLVVVTIHQQ